MPSRSATRHPLDAWLRSRIVALRASTLRRRFPGSVELVRLGAPAGTAPAASWVYGAEATDHALRVDVLVRLLTASAAQVAGPVVLAHVRPGRHEPGDHDLGWAAAGEVASGVSGVDVVGVVAVSRWGWHDLGSGVERSWVRPRAR